MYYWYIFNKCNLLNVSRNQLNYIWIWCHPIGCGFSYQSPSYKQWNWCWESGWSRLHSVLSRFNIQTLLYGDSIIQSCLYITDSWRDLFCIGVEPILGTWELDRSELWTVAYLGFHKGGPNFLWPLMLTQWVRPNQVFKFFSYVKKNFFLPKGGHGTLAPLNTLLAVEVKRTPSPPLVLLEV